MVREHEDGEDEILGMGDCAINIKPDADQLAESAIESAKTAAVFGIDPKVAMLSYSTKGSGAGEDVDKVKAALEKVKELAPELDVDGELQFDAAVSPVFLLHVRRDREALIRSVGHHNSAFRHMDRRQNQHGF